MLKSTAKRKTGFLAFSELGEGVTAVTDEVVSTVCRCVKTVRKTYNNLITACGRSFSKLGEAKEGNLSPQ